LSAWYSGVAMFPIITLNMTPTRFSARPLFCMGTKVLSNVGSDGFAAIAAYSCRRCSSAIRSASPYRSGEPSSQGGTPPNGPGQGASRGLLTAAASAAGRSFAFPEQAPMLTSDMIDTSSSSARMLNASHEYDDRASVKDCAARANRPAVYQSTPK